MRLFLQLKEFQLQKKLQVQETLSKQQDLNIIHTNESISQVINNVEIHMFCTFECIIVEKCFQQCQTNCQTAEMDELCDQKNQNEVKCMEKQYEKHVNDTDIIHKEENVISHFDGASNLVDMTETKIAANSNERTEKSFPILENYSESTALHKSDNKDDMHSHLQSDLQSVGNNGRYNLNVTASNGPSTVQKEYLLEMASEVAHALTDDIEHGELPSSFNLDLKCRNQFLSSCLEEQKQLVNDLHVQVSRYVSIL